MSILNGHKVIILVDVIEMNADKTIHSTWARAGDVCKISKENKALKEQVAKMTQDLDRVRSFWAPGCTPDFILLDEEKKEADELIAQKAMKAASNFLLLDDEQDDEFFEKKAFNSC